ncbi:MAG: heavy metal translocating P-type ATPase [Planctomycetota bacterium]|jgi:Cd2+/Zn2+-exporting ATPase
MDLSAPVSPARRALNPILLDAPVVEADETRASVFYTPQSQVLARHMPLIAAASAGAFLLAAFIARKVGAPQSLAHLLTLVAFAIAGLPALESVWQSLRRFRIDIDVLMLLGAALAAVIGSPMEGALLLVLFALSGALETYALQRTQSAIVALRRLMPDEAMLLTDAGPQAVRLQEVALGGRVLVRPGDRVPLDGRVVEGASAVDESAITGESIPREKAPGDEVFAGTVNTSGRLVVEVTKLAGDTTLARIVKLVTEARHRKADTERLIDRIGPPYSVAVIVLSIAVAVTLPALVGLSWTEGIHRGIAVLIVGSPCALIIATPVAYLSAIAGAARRGVLIKGGAYMETLAKTAVMVFDKTGTLTAGRVQLVDVVPLDGADPSEALRLAGAIEASSTHPLATAVMAAFERRGLAPYAASDFSSTPGEGVSGRVNDREVWIGRPDLAIQRLEGSPQEECRGRVEQVRRAGQTAAIMLVDGAPTLLVYEDTLREGAVQCVATLRDQGVGRIEMLTGDHELVASAISGRLGLDGFEAELLPEHKLAVSRRLRGQYGHVVMVGDGVNDAPALVEADVGIAIGSIGADVVLMGERIEQIAWLHGHARRTASIVRQNLTLAIAVIVVLGCLAVATSVPLPLAVIGHEGSTVLVALNALRLLGR